MTDRSANYGRARLWLRSPGPAPLPPACRHLVCDALALQGRAGLGEGQTDRHKCPWGRMKSRPRSALTSLSWRRL